MNSLALQIPNIRCANCALKVESVLTPLAGVSRCRTNVAQKRVIVEHDDLLLSEPEIIRTLESEGFETLVADDHQSVVEQYELQQKQLLGRLGVAGIGMMQVMMFALANYVSANSIEPAYVQLMHWASFAVATPIAMYSAMPFHLGAILSIKQRQLSMDVPVSLAILSAYFLSTWHLFNVGDVYFDTVCMFAFFLLVGRYLELRSRQQYEESVSMTERLLPKVAYVLGLEKEIPVQEIEPGMQVRVLPGEHIPVDGVIEVGDSEVCEAAFTGEANTIHKQMGAHVLAGSENAGGTLTVTSLVRFDEFVISKLAQLHQESMLYKPNFSLIADRVASVFVASILLIAMLAGVFWYQAGNPDWFVIVITVLVVSCPCALSLATPVVYTVAVTALKHRGIVVSAGKFLEQLSEVDHIVFDKTGTLTEGQLKVSDVLLCSSDLTEAEVLSLCAALERESKHPIARAFDAPSDVVVSEREQTPGLGVSGIIDGRRYFLGKSTLPDFENAHHRSGTWVCLSENEPLAWIQLQDELRQSSKDLVAALKPQFEISLLSGDQDFEVQRVASVLGFEHAVGDLLPEEKVKWVRRIQANNEKVLMVGDGINDAAAMGIADTAIAVSPVDILVQEAADATLLRQDINKIKILLAYSHRLRKVIRQNIGWAIVYNICVIPFAVTGYLEPWMAALGMSMSSLLVIANANRLNRVGDT